MWCTLYKLIHNAIQLVISIMLNPNVYCLNHNLATINHIELPIFHVQNWSNPSVLLLHHGASPPFTARTVSQLLRTAPSLWSSSYGQNAACSACGKAFRWQRALQLTAGDLVSCSVLVDDGDFTQQHPATWMWIPTIQLDCNTHINHHIIIYPIMIHIGGWSSIHWSTLFNIIWN